MRMVPKRDSWLVPSNLGILFVSKFARRRLRGIVARSQLQCRQACPCSELKRRKVILLRMRTQRNNFVARKAFGICFAIISANSSILGWQFLSWLGGQSQIGDGQNGFNRGAIR
jgi:hypothetical protein